MNGHSPPRTQPATSPSRWFLQQIECRPADFEAARAHRETPQRVSQLEHRLPNEIAALCQQLQAVATFQTQEAQVTSTPKQARATSRTGPVARRIADQRLPADFAEEHQQQQRSSRRCSVERSSRPNAVQQRSSAHCCFHRSPASRPSRGSKNTVLVKRKWT